MVKMADFNNLISRKIEKIRKYLNFHTVARRNSYTRMKLFDKFTMYFLFKIVMTLFIFTLKRVLLDLKHLLQLFLGNLFSYDIHEGKTES